MNNNHKSTQFSQDDVLVVVTDPKAVINYASDDFCRIFGYSREQLIGNNINILRHPQMPEGPLKQLWETISQGQPWMGIILNQNAGRDEVWVDTYIIPSIENDAITEYQCIYRKPSADTIKRAASVYEQRRQGKMPKTLSRKQIALGNRLSLMMLPALLPALGVMLWQSPTLLSFIAAAATTLLCVSGCKLLTRRFQQLVGSSRQIVSHPVKQLLYTGTTDDIGQLELTQCMLQSQLDVILRRIQNASGEVEKSSLSSARVMASTCDNIQSQQNALEHIAVAVEQMTATTGEVAQNTRSARDQAEQAQQDAQLGTGIVHNAVDAIKALDVSIGSIGSSLESLVERSGQIDKVVDVIHSIADQTNLLALNAAIEAARAGENGRGFAVVADEVRVLAQRTRVSTTEISTIIEQLQMATATTSTEMKEAQSLAESTVQQIEAAGNNLISIIEAIDSINSMTIQIASASEQQSAVTHEVNAQIHAISDAANDASKQARQTLQHNNTTARLAQQQNNMVEVLANGK